GTELELISNLFEPRLLIELSLLEPLHDELRDALRVVYRRTPGCELGPAAQTGTEAGLLAFLGGVEKSAVGRFRGLHRADRPAVDPGRRHGDEEDAVEPGIARGECLIEPPFVTFHEGS